MSRAEPSLLHVDIEQHLGNFHLQVCFEMDAEILVLFGPSGAGKTTTLNAIAGLSTPDAGLIRLGERIFFSRRRGADLNLPARRRGVGYVFQHHALFPHLNALENVAYALWRRSDGEQRARALLERMGLSHLEARYPRELSGGQQQRVAIARALALCPGILLLDEPFSALDLSLRQRLQRELCRLQAELELLVVYVTHSLDDAFAVGRRLAVLQEGRIRQLGPVDEVFRYPADRQVAEIMGIRNLFRARVVASTSEHLLLDWDGLRLELPAQTIPAQRELTVYIRPEDIKILYPDRPLAEAVRHNVCAGRILAHQRFPQFHSLRLRLDNTHEIEVRFPDYAYHPLALEEGRSVHLSLRRERLSLLQPPRSR